MALQRIRELIERVLNVFKLVLDQPVEICEWVFPSGDTVEENTHVFTAPFTGKDQANSTESQDNCRKPPVFH